MVNIAAVLLLAGVSAAPASPKPFTPASTGFVWKDAAGVTVTGAVTDCSFPNDVWYADANGYIWTLETDNLVPFAVLNAGELFESTDCTGPAYLALTPSPRWILKIDVESTFRVIVDNAPPVSHHVLGSYLTSDGCASGPFGEFDGIPLSATIGGITPPVLPYQAPLHPELPR